LAPHCRELQIGTGHRHRERVHREIGGIALKEIIDIPTGNCGRVRGGVPQGRNAGGMTATRRLAAILAADVAGYSRLMGSDEEGTHERLKAHLSG
jgi:hypothetical protein